MNKEILNRIQDADFILVGIGEEFEELRKLTSNKDYQDKRKVLEETGFSWCIPVMNQLTLKDMASQRNTVLNELACILDGKDYFVVSTVTSSCVENSGLDNTRVVAPCGGILNKQCSCDGKIEAITEQELRLLESCIIEEEWQNISLGACHECGKPYTLNNIYADNYMECGYLEDWQTYTKWLQMTLNRKLLVLELGVGMEYPSVIRWPFEKIVYYNQKSSLIRVNEKLYHLSEEIKERGRSVESNSIEWLLKIDHVIKK